MEIDDAMGIDKVFWNFEWFYSLAILKEFVEPSVELST